MEVRQLHEHKAEAQEATKEGGVGMMAPKLPSVLQAPRNNSISMERSLKQIRELLEGIQSGKFGDSIDDRVNASLDDLDLMIRNIDND